MTQICASSDSKTYLSRICLGELIYVHDFLLKEREGLFIVQSFLRWHCMIEFWNHHHSGNGITYTFIHFCLTWSSFKPWPIRTMTYFLKDLMTSSELALIFSCAFSQKFCCVGEYFPCGELILYAYFHFDVSILMKIFSECLLIKGLEAESCLHNKSIWGSPRPFLRQSFLWQFKLINICVHQTKDFFHSILPDSISFVASLFMNPRTNFVRPRFIFSN